MLQMNKVSLPQKQDGIEVILQPLTHTAVSLSPSLLLSLSFTLSLSLLTHFQPHTLPLRLSLCLCPSSSPSLAVSCEIWAQLLKGQQPSIPRSD